MSGTPRRRTTMVGLWIVALGLVVTAIATWHISRPGAIAAGIVALVAARRLVRFTDDMEESAPATRRSAPAQAPGASEAWNQKRTVPHSFGGLKRPGKQ